MSMTAELQQLILTSMTADCTSLTQVSCMADLLLKGSPVLLIAWEAINQERALPAVGHGLV